MIAILPLALLGQSTARWLLPEGSVPQATPGAVDNSAKTASVPVHLIGLTDMENVRVSDVARLKDGLDALSGGDVAAARAKRDSLPAGSLDRHVLAWAIAVQGDEVGSDEIAATARELRGWPGMETLRRNGERALSREKPAPNAVIEALAGSQPKTAEGVIVLARSHVALGEIDKARAVLLPMWRNDKLDAQLETAIIREFGTLIPAPDHRARMERMLYFERAKSAGRVAGLAGAPELAKAWTAVIQGDGNARKLLDAVPQQQRTTGYSFAKSRYLRRAKLYKEAAAILLAAPRDKASLIDPDAWWVERRALSREMMDAGDMKSAYAIAAAHSAESPVNTVDAEFHSGWYALRGLRDAKTAAVHFGKIVAIAEGPISLSRGYYWLGRAAEEGAPGNSRMFFEKAATYGTSFYGQLAAARIGSAALDLDYPVPTAADRASFSRREAVQAIDRLERAGHAPRADILYRDLAQELTSPGELVQLAAMAEKRGSHFMALRVGKIAAARGVRIGGLSHPVGAIPQDASISGAGAALAYAVARQESEFNAAAVSGAGARGLLQLLPATAEEVARKAGLPYSQARLTTDAGYNATLGAAFLSEQLGRFDGSYVLTIAGYNAGPRRAQQWMKRYGDPRGKDIDAVVDWIERIPYTETRTYVQRVMENYQVYKMRLSGQSDMASDLVSGR